MDLLNLIDWLLIPAMIILLNSEYGKRPVIPISDKNIRLSWVVIYSFFAVYFLVWMCS